LIVENNQYAYSTPVSKQICFDEIATRAIGYGIPGIRIDGNDVLAVYRTTVQAVERARRGEGPTLIECLTMRMRGHSEQDNASYVPRELLAEWEAKDPIDRFELWLLQGGIVDHDLRDEIRVESRRLVDEAAQWADQQPFPEPDSALRGVYGRSESGQA